MPHTATTGEEGIFPTSANTSGMTGVTIENTQQNFHKTKKSLGVCWVPQEARAINRKWCTAHFQGSLLGCYQMWTCNGLTVLKQSM